MSTNISTKTIVQDDGITVLSNDTINFTGSGVTVTNVGAPNNNQGTYFVATGVNPNWGSTTNPDMLTYNTGAPVVTVLENTIGNVWFTYNNVGVYGANSGDLFPFEKTALFIGSANDGDVEGVNFAFFRHNDINNVIIATKDFLLGNQDGYLYKTPIEIRVYN